MTHSKQSTNWYSLVILSLVAILVLVFALLAREKAADTDSRVVTGMTGEAQEQRLERLRNTQKRTSG